MLSVNRKHVQLVKIYMPCNFEVSLITRLGVIAIFSYLFSSPGHARYYHHLASVVRQLTFHILIFSSETTWPNGTTLGSKHLCKVLYKCSPYRSVPPINMAAKGNYCFWLATAWQNGAKLGRKHLCKILYKASSFGSIRPTNMAAKINSFFLIG
jgi:hypothetical protein